MPKTPQNYEPDRPREGATKLWICVYRGKVPLEEVDALIDRFHRGDRAALERLRGSGHAWIEFQPAVFRQRGWEPETYGLWGRRDARFQNEEESRDGVCKNRERNLGYSGETTDVVRRACYLTEEQEDRFLELYSESYARGPIWSHEYTCASWAAEIWKKVTGESLNELTPAGHPKAVALANAVEVENIRSLEIERQRDVQEKLRQRIESLQKQVRARTRTREE